MNDYAAPTGPPALRAVGLTPEQIALIKSTVAKGCSDNELRLFLHACEKTGLDPLLRQIYAVKRGTAMAIQTGIDGFRLIAERTGRYAPGREPSFIYSENAEKIISATAYIKKQTPDGTWHEVAATAMFDEYCPGGQFWQKMPHVMIAKVAEALALRRAFPMELSGVYSTEEMTQADLEQEAKNKFKKLTPYEAGVEAGIYASEQVEAANAARSKSSPTPGEGPQGTDTETRLAASDPPAVSTSSVSPVSTLIRPGQHRALEAGLNEFADAFGLSREAVRARMKQRVAEDLGVEHFPDLTLKQYEQVQGWIADGYTRKEREKA